MNEINETNGLMETGNRSEMTGQDRTPPPIGFEGDYHPLRGIVGGSAIIEAVLKHPAALVYELTKGRSRAVAGWLMLVLGICLLAYGLIMGSFKGGIMYLVAPAKMVLGVLLSSLLCLPSLYIFSSMGGSRQTLSETAGLLLLCQTLAGLLLLGFMPIVWIFSQSTRALAFMGSIHLVMWILATVFAVRLLSRTFELLNRQKMGILNVWAVLFIVVTLQMSTALRPLIAGPGVTFIEHEKIFFLTHWGKCLNP